MGVAIDGILDVGRGVDVVDVGPLLGQLRCVSRRDEEICRTIPDSRNWSF
jgi:hypothetical protein